MMLRRLVEAGSQGVNGVMHVVISLTELGYHGTALRAQGVEVHALGLRGPLALLVGVFKLTTLLRRVKPQIVQTWMVHSDLLGGIAARLVGVAHVIWGIRTTDYSVESPQHPGRAVVVCQALQPHPRQDCLRRAGFFGSQCTSGV